MHIIPHHADHGVVLAPGRDQPMGGACALPCCERNGNEHLIVRRGRGCGTVNTAKAMIPRTEVIPLPATAPWLLHSLRMVFDAKQESLLREATMACIRSGQKEVVVKFMHKCMEVSAVFDSTADRFTELRACDIGETESRKPSYCITMDLRLEERF